MHGDLFGIAEGTYNISYQAFLQPRKEHLVRKELVRKEHLVRTKVDPKNTTHPYVGIFPQPCRTISKLLLFFFLPQPCRTISKLPEFV